LRYAVSETYRNRRPVEYKKQHQKAIDSVALWLTLFLSGRVLLPSRIVAWPGMRTPDY